jgi:hypothetical protein
VVLLSGEAAITSTRPIKRMVTVRAKTYVDVFALSRSAFDEVREVFPEASNEVKCNQKPNARAISIVMNQII